MSVLPHGADPSGVVLATTPPALDRREEGPADARTPERVVVSLLALGAVAALFLFRSLDDNRLTSWAWVFAGAHPARLYALAAAAVVVANLAARVALPRRGAAAVLFVSSYGLGACFWGAPEVLVDASRYFTQAKHLELYGVGHFLAEWGRSIPAWTDLPLVPLLYGLAFELFGESRIAIQALTTLLFAGSVVLTWRLGRALWDEEAGFLAGALLLAIPYLLTQVPGMLVDVPTMFFVTLAVLAVVLAIQRGGAGRIVLASVAVSLALFSKYSASLVLSALPVVWIAHRRTGAPRPLLTGVLVALLTGALVAAAVASRHEAFSQQLRLLLAYQAPGLRRWGESFSSTFLFQVHPFLSAAALASIPVAIARRDARYAIVLGPVLVLVALRVERIRYLLPAFPMLALMGAYGLQAIRARETRRLVVACAVASSLAVALYGYLPFLRRTSAVNLKDAGEYLDSLGEERVEVFTPSPAEPEVNPAVSVPILDLFTKKELVYAYAGAPPSAKRRAQESPLRFTWEYENPAYYEARHGGGDTAVAVVSGDAEGPLPEPLRDRLRDHRLARVFAADEGVFGHKTVVSVYRAAPRSQLEPGEGRAR